jgi:hypothetical protein
VGRAHPRLRRRRRPVPARWRSRVLVVGCRVRLIRRASRPNRLPQSSAASKGPSGPAPGRITLARSSDIWVSCPSRPSLSTQTSTDAAKVTSPRYAGAAVRAPPSSASATSGAGPAERACRRRARACLNLPNLLDQLPRVGDSPAELRERRVAPFEGAACPELLPVEGFHRRLTWGELRGPYGAEVGRSARSSPVCVMTVRRSAPT